MYLWWQRTRSGGPAIQPNDALRKTPLAVSGDWRSICGTRTRPPGDQFLFPKLNSSDCALSPNRSHRGVPSRDPGPSLGDYSVRDMSNESCSSYHCRPLGVRIHQSPSTRTAAFVRSWNGVSSDVVYPTAVPARIASFARNLWPGASYNAFKNWNSLTFHVPPIWQ
jgi:hypothetical protein